MVIEVSRSSTLPPSRATLQRCNITDTFISPDSDQRSESFVEIGVEAAAIHLDDTELVLEDCLFTNTTGGFDVILRFGNSTLFTNSMDVNITIPDFALDLGARVEPLEAAPGDLPSADNEAFTSLQLVCTPPPPPSSSLPCHIHSCIQLRSLDRPLFCWAVAGRTQPRRKYGVAFACCHVLASMDVLRIRGGACPANIGLRMPVLHGLGVSPETMSA